MPVGCPIPLVHLNNDERKTLEDWSHNRKMTKTLAFRARLILACAEGKSNSDVATELCTTVHAVGKWRVRFIKSRLYGLLDKTRPGAPQKIADAGVERVSIKTLTSTPKDLTQWNACSMAKEYGFKLYKSLGSLIKDYRQQHEISQETLAESIGVSVRELQRWETNRRRAHIGNLHDLSEVTGIPMQVCVALNADQPVWLELTQRRFAYSSLEAEESEQFSVQGIQRYRERSDDGILLSRSQITTEKHIRLILSSHCDIYATNKPLKRDVIKTASIILPDLNHIIFDCWGHYVGHQVCLPIQRNAYEQIKKEKAFGDILTSEKMIDIKALGEGVFLFYSILAPNKNIAYTMQVDNLRYYSTIAQKKGYLVAVYASSTGTEKFFNDLGMRKIRSDAHKNVEAITPLYELEMEAIMNVEGPFKKYFAGEISNNEYLSVDEIKQDRSCEGKASGIPTGTRHLPKEQSDKKPPVAEVLTLDKHCEVLSLDDSSQTSSNSTNKKQKQKNEISDSIRNAIACPNPNCPQNGRQGESRIVSNGTYRSTKGTFPQFLCRHCGKSFSSKAGTIFYGLRSPEAKVLEAFKLLVRGMPLRRVASALGIELHTVRHWLNFAVTRHNKIDAALMKALDVSQVELDALWASVKKGTLRQRAVLWKTSNASSVE